jgi:hypothetical protein
MVKRYLTLGSAFLFLAWSGGGAMMAWLSAAGNERVENQAAYYRSMWLAGLAFAFAFVLLVQSVREARWQVLCSIWVAQLALAVCALAVFPVRIEERVLELAVAGEAIGLVAVWASRDRSGNARR